MQKPFFPKALVVSILLGYKPLFPVKPRNDNLETEFNQPMMQ